MEDEEEHRDNDIATNSGRKRRQKMDSNMKHSLIMQVYRHPGIWNRDVAQLKNEEKAKIWKRITDLINSNYATNYPAGIYIDTWGNLRDTLKKFRRKLKTHEELLEKIGDLNDPKPTWEFYEELWFLNDHMEKRERREEAKAMTNGLLSRKCTRIGNNSQHEYYGDVSGMEASNSLLGTCQNCTEDEDQSLDSLFSPNVKDEPLECNSLVAQSESNSCPTETVKSAIQIEPPPTKKPMGVERVLEGHPSLILPPQISAFASCSLCNTQGVSDNMRAIGLWSDKTSTLAIRLCFSDVVEELRMNSHNSTSEQIFICETHLCDVHESEYTISDGNDRMVPQWSCLICGQQKSSTQLKKIYKRNIARKLERVLEIGNRLSSNKDWPLRICGKHVSGVQIL